jgi:putative SOS response-associated peptidase YedK
MIAHAAPGIASLTRATRRCVAFVRKRKPFYAFAMADDSQMVMAAPWARWRDPRSGDEVLSCLVLTCEPDTSVAESHDRMPVILSEADRPQWPG